MFLLAFISGWAGLFTIRKGAVGFREQLLFVSKTDPRGQD